MKKLTKDEIKKKLDYHKKRTSFYKKKYDEAEKKSKRIGFKYYD